MRIANRTFAPGLAGTLATIVMVPLLASLGVWQLHRAQEKRELAQLAVSGGRNVVTLTAANVPQLNRYQHVNVQGRYDATRQVLLDNMPARSGAPGYRVLTPFILADSHVVLVDRGWAPLGKSRTDLPAIDMPNNTTPVRITGVLDRLPAPGIRLGAPQMKDTWPRVLSFPRYEELAQAYGPVLLQGIVLLDRTEPLGFEREWQHTEFGPERHVGYAVQWFGLATTVFVIYIAVNLKRRGEDE
jgi:surfeit locus 1 family protein